jgi:hypothetical protein
MSRCIEGSISGAEAKYAAGGGEGTEGLAVAVGVSGKSGNATAFRVAPFTDNAVAVRHLLTIYRPSRTGTNFHTDRGATLKSERG